MEIITRKEAIERGLETYFTGKPCLRGHVCVRPVSCGTCCACAVKRKAKYRKENAEKLRGYHTKYYKENSEKYRQRGAKYYKENPEKILERNAKYRKENPEKTNARAASRRAQQLKASPSWANRGAILQIYTRARELGHHVDHIVPLKSKLVCGLHCEANLQILPPAENMTKGNHHWPDMP